eukprot:c9377_g1_i3.p1 GENE.c9377_g1_i3~~c9377_g1_i3.p1  ORF type:complete len:282 (-),score=68.81 c9377_g1_i3:128-937(-)
MRARALDFSFLAACISSPTPLIRIPPFHLIVLNTPLPGYFLNLWRTAKTRICADGGSNRVLGFQGWNGREKLPDCVVGDLDSAAPQALSFFRSKQVVVKLDKDQDTNDLQKSIAYLIQTRPEASNQPIVILGDTSGRFDHVMAALNVLHLHPTLPLVVLSDLSVLVLVPPSPLGSTFQMTWPAEWCPMKCGFAPMCGEALVTTQGLEWNLDNAPMKFGGLVSTSNMALDPTVRISSSLPLLWTCSLPGADSSLADAESKRLHLFVESSL